ncbi:MAG: DUF2326 domain-containing protein [Succinivibrionaceae bacterium]
MLVEVQCDKFKKNGQNRGTICFHAGLNAILGDDNGSNSIGKSTFLMILDFVFGGSDYIKRCIDVQQNIKEHNINFSFCFGEKRYYFSRNTVEYNKVYKCDSSYQILKNEKPLSLQDYGDFLCNNYGLISEGITWRAAVGRFIRVYKRDTLDEERPLHSSKEEKPADAVKNYMRLFDKYSAVASQIKLASEAEDEKEAFRKTIQYNKIHAAKNIKERNENEARIEELEHREKMLAEKSNQGLLDLDSITASKIASLTEQLIKCRRQLTRVQMQLNAVRRDTTQQKIGFKRTFSDLEKFFPSEQFRTLEELERFHQKLAQILDGEFKEVEKDLVSTHALLEEKIVELENQIKEYKTIPNVSQAILREFALITGELKDLKEANQHFDELERLKKQSSDYAEARDKLINTQLLSIETAVNDSMAKITSTILNDETHLPPLLRLERLKKYSFNTPNDGGTGAQYRGMITFDLANMNLSPLPFVVHDSVLLKNIEKTVFSEIIKAYASQANNGKQVFMAYDTLDSYDHATQQLIKNNAVLELSPGGNELFGWAWNKDK